MCVLQCHIDKELAANFTMLDDPECTTRFEIKQAFRSELATIIASTLGVSGEHHQVQAKEWSLIRIIQQRPNLARTAQCVPRLGRALGPC